MILKGILIYGQKCKIYNLSVEDHLNQFGYVNLTPCKQMINIKYQIELFVLKLFSIIYNY